MAVLRLYIETSVWSHYYADDAPERRAETIAFFDRCLAVRDEVELVISSLVGLELAGAESRKARMFVELLARIRPTNIEDVPGVQELAAEYLRLGAVPPSKLADAMHAALATVHELDALVSWNYRHMVSLPKRRKINAVNAIMGYLRTLDIISPPEVFGNDNQ